MNTAKPWYLSKTIWASIVGVASALAGIAGVPVGGVDNGVLTETILQAVTALSGIAAILGRLAADARIG